MEPDTFWTLLHNAAHWEFELLLLVIFDGVIGIFLLPLFRKKILHHRSDDHRIALLEKQVKALQERITYIDGEVE